MVGRRLVNPERLNARDQPLAQRGERRAQTSARELADAQGGRHGGAARNAEIGKSRKVKDSVEAGSQLATARNHDSTVPE